MTKMKIPHFRKTAAALFCLLAILSVATFAAENIPPLKADTFASSASCGSCHAEILAKWKDSMHSQAVQDPIFQTAYMQAFLDSGGKANRVCTSCHAPTTATTGDYDMKKEISREGIACHFCHSIAEIHSDKKERFELKIGRTIRGPKGGIKSDYHDSVASPLHRKAEICAGCHEYAPKGVKIMSTWSEWKNSPYATKGITCQTCHLPQEPKTDENGKTRMVYSHSLAGGHSIAQLKKAVTVQIKGLQRGKDRITAEVEVENSGSGHYVPTGIPTRKLILYCQVKFGEGKILRKNVTFEKIVFDENGRELTNDSSIMLGEGAQIVKDNRLPPGEKRKEQFVFYEPTTGPVEVTAWVDYLYQPQLIQPTEMRMEMGRSEQTFAK